MTVGTLEAHGKLRRQDRPWAMVRSSRPRRSIFEGVDRVPELEPARHGSGDGPMSGRGLELAGEIARLRAAAIAQARLVH